MANKYFKGKKVKAADKPPESDAPMSQDIQDWIVNRIQSEYSAAEENLQKNFDKGDEYYDMLHCVREDPQFDDEPNIYLPEYLSRVLAEQGNFCSAYFQSRDFVDVYYETEDPQDVAEAKASKRLLNHILNMRESYTYYKISRMKMAMTSKGYAIIKGGYRQVIEQNIIDYEEKREYETDDDGNFLDVDGEIVVDPYVQQPMETVYQEPIYEDVVVEDRPTFDVYPNKCVFFSPEYVYSLRDKRYIIFEDEKTLPELEEEASEMGYFNLDILRERAKQTREIQDRDGNKVITTVYPMFKIQERWGKDWAVDDEPGVDDEGQPKEKAELKQCIETIASWDLGEQAKGEVLIRWQVSPFSQVPAVRFLCYVDEEDDSGFGDGEGALELQGAINDTFNLGLYRTMLATKPSFKARRWANVPDKVRVHSEETIQLENMDDLQELMIKDDISGSMNQVMQLGGAMDKLTAYGPSQMGMETSRKETATVASIMEERSSIRQGLKNLNLEFIGFTDFYEMLLSLCNDFMLPETLEKILGQDAVFYNPERKDRFKPVSQAIETEASKNFKVSMWDQVLGRVVNLAQSNPKGPAVINYIIGQILEIMGGEFKHFKPFMFEEDPESVMLYQLATGAKQPPQQPEPPGLQGQGQPSNEQGLPQSQPEQQARQGAPMQ